MKEEISLISGTRTHRNDNSVCSIYLLKSVFNY